MTDNIGKDQLRQLAQRRVRLEEEREALSSDIKDINAEAKALGYSPKAFNAAIRISRMSAVDREKHEQYEMELSVYVGVLDDTSGV